MKSLMMFFRSNLFGAFLFEKRVSFFVRLPVLAVGLAILLALGRLGANEIKPTYAQGPELKVTSTIHVPAEILSSVIETLRTRPDNILPGSIVIITSLDQNSGWSLMTVAVQPSNPDEDILANSTLVIARSEPQGWSSAIWGTDAYEALLSEAPSSLVPAESKQLLSSTTNSSPSAPQAISTSLRWPWSSSATWTMTQGPHSWWGAGGAGPMSSIDFAPLGSDLGVHAAAAGTIIRRCDSTQTRELIIRHPTGTSNDDVTGYLHLDKNTPYSPSMPLGSSINAGDYIGTIYNGKPNDKCGWGSGPHLHFWIATIPTSTSCTGPGACLISNFNFSSMYGQTISGWQMQNDNCFHKGSERPICPGIPIPGDGSTPGPRPPSNLSTNAVSSSQINLSWNGSPDSVDGYRIYSGNSMIANKVTGTSYSVSGLNSCSTYSFYVTAYKGDLESASSNTASAKTSGCSSGAPSAPSLSSPGNGQVFGRYDAVTLVWNSNGAYQYLPEFWGMPDNGISQLPWQTGTSLTIGGGVWGGTYSWHVKARNSSGQVSDWSETRSFFKKYGTPNNVSVSALSDSQTRLTWGPSADAPGNIEGYKIYRDGQLRYIAGSGATSFDDYDLLCNHSYSYYLKAYKGNGESDTSSTVSVTTNNCPPPGPSANFDAWPLNGPAPLVVAMHIVDTSNITSCSWDYGDGQTGASCASSHNHTYTIAGTYSVQLTVHGPGGDDSMTRNDYITVTGSPLSVSWLSPSDGQAITSRSVHLQADPSGGSGGINHVSFSALYNGSWHGVQDVSSSPWGYDWDLCNSGVPDGDIELGLEAWDNGGNHYVYSEQFSNFHITKSYNCNSGSAPTAPSSPSPEDGAIIERTADTTFYWNTDGTSCDFVKWNWDWTQDVMLIGVNCTSVHIGQQWPGAYQWRVTAHNSNGASDGPIWNFNVKPYAPTNLHVTESSQTQVNLLWTQSNDDPGNVDSYKIYDGSGTFIASVGAGLWSYNVSNLTCGTPYSFYVTAGSEGVESNASNTVDVSTGLCEQPTVAVTNVWTADGDGNPKVSFTAGDSIQYLGNIQNSSSITQTASYVWSVNGSCGSIVYYEGDFEAGIGTWTWTLPSSVPSNACPGTYTYQLSVTFNNNTTSKSTAFTISNPNLAFQIYIPFISNRQGSSQLSSLRQRTPMLTPTLKPVPRNEPSSSP
jgi:PKD repeat protein